MIATLATSQICGGKGGKKKTLMGNIHNPFLKSHKTIILIRDIGPIPSWNAYLGHVAFHNVATSLQGLVPHCNKRVQHSFTNSTYFNLLDESNQLCFH
jgi:hypothetical protein